MNKQLLIETIPFTPIIPRLLESKSIHGLPMVEGILATAEVNNGNGRFYKKRIWESEIEKYMDSVKNNFATGELDHPESTVINLKNVCHKIKDIWWEGNHIMGITEIVSTPSGNILRSLLDAKVKLGISSRGMGSVKQIGETLEVQDDFELLCFDFVSTPSNPGSWMTPLHEGKNHGFKTTGNKSNDRVNEIIREILCEYGNCPIF